MKLNFLLLLIVFFCFSIASFAQKDDFAVKVLAPKIDANKNSVALVIKRKTGAEFDKKQRISFHFYLLKCPKAENCNTLRDEYAAVGSVKGKKLAKTETRGFRMNLGGFNWYPTMSSIRVQNPAPNFFEVPKENKYFHAEIEVCKRRETKKAEAVCTTYVSNEIVLKR